jgi:ABC-type dipeptide/oligopeptide/nickel transport system permease subunit
LAISLKNQTINKDVNITSIPKDVNNILKQIEVVLVIALLSWIIQVILAFITFWNAITIGMQYGTFNLTWETVNAFITAILNSFCSVVLAYAIKYFQTKVKEVIQ